MLPRARGRHPRRRAVTTLVAALLVTLLPLGVASAWAEDPPPNPTDEQIEQAQRDKAAQAAEVGRLSGLVSATAGEIELLQVVVENASSDYIAAQGALDQARLVAERTGAAVEDAAAAVDRATADLAVFARNSYIQGSTLDSSFVLLDSDGPAELIERAGLLDALSSRRLDVVSQVELANVDKANADSAQRQAVLEREAAERAAADALALAQSTLAESQSRLGQLQAQQGQYEAQLQVAQQALLGVEGQRRAFEEYQARKAAEEARLQRQREEQAQRAAAVEAAARANPGGTTAAPAAQSGDWVAPAVGPITSCYCMRWGTMHWGIDIGAPMYDPIYAVGAGTVVRAGPATGFGQAIYIEHDNGDVTVYGHEEVIKVSEGQRVYPGQVIALVGTRGFSTGPHLHFEVQLGLYGPRTDPIPWLAARGVYL